jgi:hypothetical protein
MPFDLAAKITAQSINIVCLNSKCKSKIEYFLFPSDLIHWANQRRIHAFRLHSHESKSEEDGEMTG